MSENAPKPRRLSLPSIEEFSTLMRTMFINVGFFAATLLLIPTVASQFTRTAIVIDPIAVPDALVKQGLTPEVVANRLWDGLQEFAATASANRETIAAIPDSQLIEFSLPDAGISIDSVFAQVRQFFQIYDTRIGGEFICSTPQCAPEGLRLRLRVVRLSSDVVDLPEMGAQTEQAYFREAAAGVYEVIDPYVAIAAQAESAPLKAATLARGLILDNSKDAKWAHNLVGQIEFRDKNYDAAISEHRAALAIDADFHDARAGLAEALLLTGDSDAAKAELDELERRAPRSALVPALRSRIAVVADDKPEAVRQMLLAAELEPLNPHHLTIAGNIELVAKNLDAGVGHLRDALSIDPSYGPALDILARALWDASRREEAEGIYRQWLEFEPNNTKARGQLGVVLNSMERYEEAAEHFELAYAAGEKTGYIAQTRAVNFFALGRYPEAAAAFEPFAAAEPAVWNYAALLGKSYELLGERQKAMTVYEAFLAAAAADDPGRARAEKKLAAMR